MMRFNRFGLVVIEDELHALVNILRDKPITHKIVIPMRYAKTRDSFVTEMRYRLKKTNKISHVDIPELLDRLEEDYDEMVGDYLGRAIVVSRLWPDEVAFRRIDEDGELGEEQTAVIPDSSLSDQFDIYDRICIAAKCELAILA